MCEMACSLIANPCVDAYVPFFSSKHWRPRQLVSFFMIHTWRVGHLLGGGAMSILEEGVDI